MAPCSRSSSPCTPAPLREQPLTMVPLCRSLQSVMARTLHFQVTEPNSGWLGNSGPRGLPPAGSTYREVGGVLGAVAQRELQAAQPPLGSSRSGVSKRTAPTVILAAVPTYTWTTLCPPSGVPCPHQGGRLTCSPCPQLRSVVSEPHSSGSGPVGVRSHGSAASA